MWNHGPTLVATEITNATGHVTFAGLVDETYTWHWSWQGIAKEHSEEIDCSEIVWPFKETVAYWTLEKTFEYEPDVPVADGLKVELRDPHATQIAVPLDTQYTVDGKVTFVDLKAGEYTLEWTWGGEYKIEAVLPPDGIEFQTPTPVVMTNSVKPKSGGG